MKTTPNYKFKKPESTDFYNIADFNDNADKIDSALAAIGNGWEAVALADFADMVNLVSSSDQWTASIRYNATSKMAKVHFFPVSVLVDYSTGMTLGTIKSTYLPAFEQYGIAIFTGSTNVSIARPLKITTDGKITIESCENQSVIAELMAMDIAYIVA